MAHFSDLFDIDDSRRAYKDVYGQNPRPHTSWTHELLSGAIGFEALKDYEDYVHRTGDEVSHPTMKKMLDSSVTAEVDRLFASKQLSFLDIEEVKRRAVDQAYKLADGKYGIGGTYNGQ